MATPQAGAIREACSGGSPRFGRRLKTPEAGSRSTRPIRRGVRNGPTPIPCSSRFSPCSTVRSPRRSKPTRPPKSAGFCSSRATTASSPCSSAYKRLDRLKGIPLVLGLNFGEEPKEEPKPAEITPDDTPPDAPETFAERTRLYNEAARNAVLLKDAGLTFALSTHGSRDIGEFMSRLRAAVKNGLPREVALRALTLDAARTYGVDKRMGTLEVGKAANVVAFTGDFLDDKTKVKMLYIDGHRIDPEAKTLPPVPNRSLGIKERR
ncbi:hypothetical protein EON81_14750 [bacterium]|nr:MAG: hypothetical protein EON81_14750 [bacterium]